MSGVTNDAGNTASYDVDGNFGLIHSAVDGRGNTVSYQYNPNHLLTGVSQAVSGLFGDGTALSAQYVYNDKDQLSQITHNGFAYSMSYDPFGSLKQVKAGAQSLVSFVYNDKHQMTAQQFGNGQSISYGYNQKDQLTGVTYQNSVRYGYEYDSSGSVCAILDYQSGRKTTMQALPDGSVKTEQVGLGSKSYSHEYGNTSGEKDSSFHESIGGREFITLFADQEGLGSEVRFTVNAPQPRSIAYQESYDGLQRSSGYQLQSKQNEDVSNLLTASYQYRDLDDERTTFQISRIDLVTGQGEGKSFTYQYDESGNIVQENGTTYQYDEAGQLIRVNDANAGKTFVYQYDEGGNIRSKKEYAYSTGNLGAAVDTVSYGYDSQWKDKLISYNGSAVTSDSIGNITAMNGWSYTWQMGRQLAAASKGNVSISYLYNENGIRTSKTVNGVKTEYTLVDDRITYQTDGTDSLYFRYDANNQLIGFEALSSDGTSTGYYYLKNLQGDIIGIIDGAGRVVVEYSYDAWGAPTGVTGSAAETIGQLNPFRYRGYYYDVETGMYYLQSRYYNPVVGRFLNADEIIVLGSTVGQSFGANLFTYCNNNPVMFLDSSGYFGTPIQWVCAAIGGIAGWFFGDYVARQIGLFPGKWYQWQTAAYWAVRGLVVVGGAVLGWVAGTALLKILTKYLLANPAIASRLPRIALWFLGMGGTTGQIANQIFQKYSSHIFEAKHGLDSLISKYGRRGVFDKAFQIVSSKIAQAQNGSNQIYTTINGVKVTIRFWFKDGTFGSFNIIKGHVSRIIGKLLK